MKSSRPFVRARRWPKPFAIPVEAVLFFDQHGTEAHKG